MVQSLITDSDISLRWRRWAIRKHSTSDSVRRYFKADSGERPDIFDWKIDKMALSISVLKSVIWSGGVFYRKRKWVYSLSSP